ncbi:Uncharacterized protein SCF082_LOCUS19201, partial [Durusdinium trenchii]
LGDLNGALQLFFDNAGTLFALIGALNFVFNFVLFEASVTTFNGGAILGLAEYGILADKITDIVFARILPGIGFSILCGGAFYAVQGALLSSKEGYQATALPYGINTPGSFAVLFGIMLPVTSSAQFGCAGFVDGAGLPLAGQEEDLVNCLADAAEAGWEAGIVTNVVVGLVSVGLSLFGRGLRQVAPPMALLTALAGIGIAFLTVGQLDVVFSQPLTGLLPLYVMLFAYFGNLSLKGFPKSALVVVIGTILGWIDQTVTLEGLQDAKENVQWYGLTPGFKALDDWSLVSDFLGTIFPVAFAAAAGTLMNVYSAEQAGDTYGVTLTMVSDGVGTIIAALFGCPFSTSVYIGHPAYKKMGAGTLYSVFNAIVLFIVSLTGLFGLILALIPGTAVAPLLIFVGLMICQEALVATRPHEYPAFILGLVPSLADYAQQNGNSNDGILALSRGALLVSLLTTTITVYGCNRQFLKSGFFAGVGAFLSLFGIIHQGGAKAKEFDVVDSFYCKAAPAFGGCDVDFQDECFLPDGSAGCASRYMFNTRFMGAYILVAALSLGLYALQRAGIVIEEPLDMADEEELQKLQMELLEAEGDAKHLAA